MPDHCDDEAAARGEKAPSRDLGAMLDLLPCCAGIFTAVRNSKGAIVDFRIDDINERACRSNRMPRSVQIGQRLNDLLPGHRESGLFGAYCAVVDTGRPFFRDRFVYADLYDRRVESRCFCISAAKHNDGFIAIWHDVPSSPQDERRINSDGETSATDEATRGRADDGKAPAPAAGPCGGPAVPEADPHHAHAMPGDDDMSAETDIPYRLMFESTHLFGAVLRTDGEVVHIIGRLLESAATEATTLVGLPFWSCPWFAANGESVRLLREAIVRTVRGEPTSLDIALDGGPAGSTIVELQLRCLPGPNGRIEHLLACGLDVTQRVKRDRALKSIERRLELAESAARIGVWEWDATTHRTYWSNMMWTLYGCSAEDRASRAPEEIFRERVLPEHLRGVHLMWQACVAGERDDIHRTIQIRRPDGTRRWLEVRAQVGRQPDGTISSLIGVNIDVSDRVEAAGRIGASEDRFRTMADELPLMVWVVGPDGGLQYVNSTYCMYFGVDASDVTGSGWHPLMHTEDRARYLANFEAALRARCDFHDLVRVRDHAGRWRHLESWGRPRIAPDGTFLGMVGTSADVTDRVEAERARAASEERLRVAVEGSPICVYENDRELRYTWIANPMPPFSVESVVGRRDEELLPLDAVAELIAMKQRVLESGTPERRQIQFDPGTGPQVFDVAAEPARDGSGAVVGLRVATSNVTPLRKADIALRRSQERLRVAQAVGRVGTFEWNIRDNVNLWSDELCILYGLEPGSFDGTYEHWCRLIHPDDVAQAEAATIRAMKEGTLSAEWRIPLRDGEVRWVEARAWVEKDHSGEPLRMIGVNLEITERKRHEERIHMLMAELNHRVKNTLAVIQAIARQTVRRSPTLESFRQSFEERLRSIARAHNLLTQTDWQGADLRDVVLNELNSRAALSEQCRVSGPPVMLRTKTALSTHMVFHELVTNACKYGSLRTTEGAIDVTWSTIVIDGRTNLQVNWSEICARPVAAPAESGYGSRLIEQIVQYELGGYIRRRFESHGLQCRIVFPIS